MEKYTKRSFLQAVGAIGGSAAVFTAMQGLNMVHASSMTNPPKMTSDGKGKKITVLGAGLAGLTLAIELQKKGYSCEILEARSFAGGRCQTARKGSVVHEIDGERQVCNFENNQYLNIGPWRIPAEHKAVLYYCHKLGIPLEPMINKSVHAYYYSENIEGELNGVKLRQIETEIDRAGNVAELLAKSANEGLLDEKLNEEDKERLVDYLKNTGLLGKRELNYRANKARGYAEYPGVGLDRGSLSETNDFSELLKVKLGTVYETADHPAVMFQAVGGMDQIAKAMEKAVRPEIIQYNSEVTNIVQHEDRVDITYMNTQTGEEKTTSSDYCISTIPVPVLKKIDNNLNADLKEALNTAVSVPAFKIGLQMDYRFWEKEDMIYGGASVSDIKNHNIISYPSSDLHSNLGGVLLANYGFGGRSVPMSNMTVTERVEHALSVGEKIHPGQYRKHYNGNAISISWHKEKYSLGAGCNWSPRLRNKHLPTILNSDKRVLISGNSITPFNMAWMTGAIESAWYSMMELDKRTAQV